MKRFGLAPPLGSVDAATQAVAELLAALEEWDTAGEAPDPVAYLEAGDGDLYVTCPLSAADAAELTSLLQAHSVIRRARRHGGHRRRRARSAGRADPAPAGGVGGSAAPGGAAGGLVLVLGGDPPAPGSATPSPVIPPARAGLIRAAAAVAAARLLARVTRPASAVAVSPGRTQAPVIPVTIRPVSPRGRDPEPPCV